MTTFLNTDEIYIIYLSVLKTFNRRAGLVIGENFYFEKLTESFIQMICSAVHIIIYLVYRFVGIWDNNLIRQFCVQIITLYQENICPPCYFSCSSTFLLILLSQATRCGSTKQMSWREAIQRGSPALTSPPTCSKSTLPSTLERTGRLTCFLGTNSGGEEQSLHNHFVNLKLLSDTP